MSESFDIAVIGSGFSGSLVATALQQQGRRVLLLEQGRHPRFAIGESSTPLANLWLEHFAIHNHLEGVVSLTQWGTWQREHPEIACGLKRGFTFYQHRFGELFQDSDRHERQLLVAASPHDGIADTHWYRPDFDHHLVRQALRVGVEYWDSVRIHQVERREGRMQATLLQSGVEKEINVALIVDATGPRGCLFRLMNLPEEPMPGIEPTQALFAHFRDVDRSASLDEFKGGASPPYAPDDAALHHLFPGGWIWILHFNNGVTSAGAALTPGLAEELRASEGASAWERLLERLPSVRRQFANATATTPFFHQPRMPFLCAQASGPGWVMLPSAQGFIDPMLSTGFPLTLLGMDRLVRGLQSSWGSESLTAMCARVVDQSRADLLRAASLVSELYQSLADFPRFVALARLYFAVVSFSETEIRLGSADDVEAAILLSSHPEFGPGLVALLQAIAGADAALVREAVDRFIEPIDVAGLLRQDRANWFPVDAEDLKHAASKLNASSEEIEGLLRRSGFQDRHGIEIPSC